MASSYFTLPSFARAKKNKEDLEKTNPQEPVLKDEDEKFFDKEMRSGSTSEVAKDAPATKITDAGEEQLLTTGEKGEAITSEDQVIVPETRPDSGIAQEGGASYDDAQKEKAATAVKERKEKKNKGMELPSQEEAEAATKGFNNAAHAADTQEGEKSQGEKKTWASYLPSMRAKRPQSSGAGDERSKEEGTDGTNTREESKGTGEINTTEGMNDGTATPRTWKEYASSYVPSMPTFKSRKTDADSQPDPVYNEDGTINEAATAEKQEREVSVLLDNLNLSSINNRVFAFSADTQRLYERFLLCLKDVVNGAPTAYEDMDKLMKEAGPKLEEQWKTMPPFVQTLVKSLPMRLAPEVMAVASENPNEKMKRDLESASKAESVAMREGGSKESEETTKKKRRIPGLKSLVSGQGAVATMLRNTVVFIQTRFPFLASMTNVVMSLAVFILMFVFWYCHKRGKEVRLAREAEEGEKDKVEEGSDGVEVSDSEDDSEVEQMIGELEKADEETSGQSTDEKARILEQPVPADVPLPAEEKEDAATKSTA